MRKLPLSFNCGRDGKVDMRHLKCLALRRVGSNPTARTKLRREMMGEERIDGGPAMSEAIATALFIGAVWGVGVAAFIIPIAAQAAKARWNGTEGVMNHSIENAARDMFANPDRLTRDVKCFFRSGDNTAEQLADYRNRAMAQIESGISLEDVDLDETILD